MGCCLSKKPSPSIFLSNGTSCAVKSPDASKPIKLMIELQENPAMEESKKVQEEGEGTTKELLVVKHRRSHERSKNTDSEEESPASFPVEKSIDSNSNSNSVVVRISSCTKDEVDAILIQCGKLSRSNSAAKTRRYSGSKRSFDFDQNQRIRGGGDLEEEEAERKTPQRNRHRGVERMNGSPRERRRRTPSREREDSKSYRSGSRERGNGAGGGSRRVSRSPGKRSETINSNSSGGGGNLVNSSNIRPGKFVTVLATDKSNNNGEPSIKRITVKRSIGEACRTAASPARAAARNVQPSPPSSSRSSSRNAEQSPYRRNPLGEIDQNATKGDNNCNKKMMKIENESAANQKLTKPQVISRSRSLRKSRDFDINQETLLQSNEEDKNTTNNYTALLLKDIKNFHGKSNVDDDDPSISFNLLPSCVTKACSIVEAVADLNSTTTTNTCFNSGLNQFRFTSTAKKADLMEPSFEKYVTVNRGCSLEEQESCGSNNLT